MIGFTDARAALVAASLAWTLALPAHAVVGGQVDSFESGSTLGWGVGTPHPVPPAVVTTGGPGGAGDGFLRLQSLGATGGDAGSRLAVRNGAQWAGDYTAAGISAITMDVFNFGPSDLSLRLLFEAGSPSLPGHAWSTVPVLVPGGSGWRSVVFPVSVTDLSPAPGSLVADVLAGAVAIRLFHGSLPGFPGEPIAVTVGVDNITAVPEPATAWLLAMGVGALALRRR